MKPKFIILVLLAAVSATVWWYLVQPRQLQFGAQVVPANGNIWVVIYGYVLTLIGVCIGTAYRELQKLKQAGQTQIPNARHFINSLLTSIDLWMGLIGSPIVYALLWKSLDQGDISGLSVIALQNGFCCTLILSNLKGADPAKQNPGDKPKPRSTSN
jgi:hypothetical protein